MDNQSNRIVTHQYRTLIDDPDELIRSIQTDKNMTDDQIKQIIYSGGLSTDQLKAIKPYNIRFTQRYHVLMNQDIDQQKQCYASMKDGTNDIPQKLLRITFQLIQRWLAETNRKIIIFGSSIVPLFSPKNVNIANCQTEDIDVAVDNISDAKDLVYFVAAELHKMQLEKHKELTDILGNTVRFKYINICQIGTKFFVRVDLSDMCPNFHFLKRFRLMDVSLVSDFLTRTDPSVYPNIELQSTVSFVLGIYDKYAGCLLNINKLTNLQLKETREKMEGRIAALTFDKSVLSMNDFNYFIDKFHNIRNCEIVQNMVRKIFCLD